MTTSDLIQGLSLPGGDLIEERATLPRGHIRLRTRCTYPDGGTIDLFLAKGGPLLSHDRISDLGLTTEWLAQNLYSPVDSHTRRRAFDEAIEPFGVRRSGGAIEKVVSSPADVWPAVWSVLQACLRASDILMTRRHAVPSTLLETLATMLDQVAKKRKLGFVPNVSLQSHFGHVPVDFAVYRDGSTSALWGLAGSSPSQASSKAHDLFRKCYDLKGVTKERVVIFDDKSDKIRSKDIDRLRDVSDPIPLSEAAQGLEEMFSSAALVRATPPAPRPPPAGRCRLCPRSGPRPREGACQAPADT